MSPVSQKHKAFVLFQSGDTQFTIEPDNEDRFTCSEQDIVEACIARDLGTRVAREFSEQMHHLLSTIGGWIAERKEQIDSAYLRIDGTRPLLVIVQSGVQCDDDLNDALTDLDLQIARGEDFNLIDLDVLAVPNVGSDARLAFLASSQVIRHYDAE